MADPRIRAVPGQGSEQFLHTPPEILVGDDDIGVQGILRDALQRAPDAVLLAGPDGRVVFGNQAAQALTGHDEEAILEQRLADLVTPLPEAPAEAPPGAPAAAVFAAELVRGDGRRIPVEASITTVRTAGRVAGRLVVARDIGERRRAEEAERHAEVVRAVALLAAGAAHEINNPLAIIHGRLELLAREDLSERARQHLEPVLAAVLRVADVIDRLGHIVRLEPNAAMPGTPMLDIRRSAGGPSAR